MKVLDPGHEYELDALDGAQANRLVFVKRAGEGYPGNVGSHPGTIMQEVLRALIDRSEYVNGQIPSYWTEAALWYLRRAVWCFEARAALRHGRPVPSEADAVSGVGKCADCGHVGCQGFCSRGHAGGEM